MDKIDLFTEKLKISDKQAINKYIDYNKKWAETIKNNCYV